MGGIAHALGYRTFEFFCLYYLQDTFVPKNDNKARNLADVHFEIWQQLEKMILKDRFDKFVLALPRGVAKSTIITYALTIWAHCYKHSKYTIVQGRTENDAIEFVTQVRQTLEENDYLIECFGRLIDQKHNTINRLELELTNETKIQAMSSTSSIRGKKFRIYRPTLIINDDSQGKEDILTQDSRNKKYRTYIEDVEYAGDEAVYRNKKKIQRATKFIVLGTVLHPDCFISRMLENPEYKHILKSVVDFNVDDFFARQCWQNLRDNKFNPEFYDKETMDFKTIWDDKYTCIDLAKKYFANPRAFKQELMNDAKNVGDKWFKSIFTMSKKEIESHIFKKTMLCVDPAASGKWDYTAYLVGSTTENDDYKYIRSGQLRKINARTSFDRYIEEMINYLRIYTDITHVFIEKNTFHGVDAAMLEKQISENENLKNRNITIINESQRRNKDDKISTIIPFVNAGKVIFCEDDTEFIEQIKEFAGQDFTQNDDAADVLSEFCIRVEFINVTNFMSLMDRKLIGV